MNKKAVILFFAFFFFMQKIIAQNFPDINFSSLNTANGLPTNLITTVFKDSRGFIWLGTEDKGLLRYDGKKVKSFYNTDGQSKGVASGYIGCVCEDHSGWLWISTTDGLYRLDPVTEKLEVYHHDDADKKSVSTNEKPIPFIDSRGRIWVSSWKGLQLFDTAAKNFLSFKIPPVANKEWKISETAIGTLYEDSKQNLWATCAYGIYLVNKITQNLEPFFTGQYITSTGMFEDNNKRFWVTFWGGGLKQLDLTTKRYTNELDPSSVIHHSTRWPDKTKDWTCFYYNNIFTLWDAATKKYHQYKVDPQKSNAIRGDYSTCIYMDDEERIWICTNSGINIIDKKLQEFNCRNLYNQINKDANFGNPMALLVDSNKFILSSWYGNHLYEYDKNWNFLKVTERVPPSSISRLSATIETMQRDEKGNTWYGTDSGLVKYAKGHYTLYFPQDTFPMVDQEYAARDMLKRSDGSYWVRFFNRGLYIFDPIKGKFYKNYRWQYKGFTTCMTYDRTGKLWLGTAKGLFYYDQVSDSFKVVPIVHINKSKTEFYNKLAQIYFDKNNTGWICTYYGLLKLNAATNTIEFINDPNKPQEYVTNRLLEDTTGVLWVVCNTDITAYNKDKRTFRYFTSSNGLPDNFQGFDGVFNWINDSTIAMAAANKIITFDPYRLYATRNSGKLLFTDFMIDGERSAFDPRLHETLIVPPNSNSINIHFALINYTASQQNELYYRLLNKKDSSWIQTTDGEITFINLAPGNYKLEIKGVSNGDITNYSTTILNIEVKPAWYQSLVFKVSMALLLSAFIYLLIHWRIGSIKKASALQQQVTETEMAALKAQMNPHFMFNCINSIDAFIQSNDKYNATLYLNKFAKLIRNVLDSSRQNTVPFVKDMETLKLYTELEELRSENKFITQFIIDEELMNSDYKVPPLIIQPFVENAIIHGLRNKLSNDGVLTIAVTKNEDHLLYIITDNGIGRVAAKNISSNKEASYGLQMSYDRIKLFNKETNAAVTITDLYNNGEATGTKIEIHLNIV